jgi:type I restriction enzyme S subunit
VKSRQETNFGTIFQPWPLKPLPEVAFFQEGPGLRKWQWTESGMKVINVTNILGDGSVDVNNTARFISTEEFESKYRHFAVDAGDIVIASSGNTYGKVGRVNHSHLPIMMNTSVIRFHPADTEKLDQNFLYSFLRSHLFKNQMESFVIGSAQPNFGPSHLKRMVIPCPDITTQRKIAGVLSAYDDLIENNTRRMAILEEMAQAIYREWFVNFRFPGHEKVKLINSPLGQIPEGWKVQPLKEVYRTSSGGTPSRKVDEYYEGGNINWVKSKELHDRFIWDTEEKITEAGLANSSAKVFPANTVIMAMYGATIGQLGILGAEATTNQACCGFLTNQSEYGYPYLFLNLLSNRTEIINLRAGAAQQNVSQDVIRETPFLLPLLPIVHEFNELVEPFLQRIFRLQKKNINLTRTRDLLLPKLISGQLDVEDLDVDTGATFVEAEA